MKQTLSYGILPEPSDFAHAFTACGDDMEMEVLPYGKFPLYTIVAKGADLANLQSAGLTTTERYYNSAVEPEGLKMQFTGDQLYSLLDNLVELWEIDSDSDYSDWAGDFASSILATLGIEWV